MKQRIFEATTSDILYDIVDRIAANNTRVTDVGLYNGKTGIAIFLYHYGKTHNSAASTQLADRFIEDVRNNVAECTSVDYSDGVPGVEAGLHYLIKKECIDTGAAKMPEAAEQALYNSLLAMHGDHIPDYLYQLTGMGKYFMLDYRRKTLMTVGPFADINRQCVAHIVNLIGCIDAPMVPRLGYKNVLRVIDVLSRIFISEYKLLESHHLLSHTLQALEATIFHNPEFKPFDPGCNPFRIALALLQTYDRIIKQDFSELAIRILNEFEGTVNRLYTAKDIRDADLLQHAIVCKKLQTVLMDNYFGECAVKCLDFYRERKNNNYGASAYNNGDDYSLVSGYAGEGMALLTLEGHIGLDWLEDLMGYY